MDELMIPSLDDADTLSKRRARSPSLDIEISHASTASAVTDVGLAGVAFEPASTAAGAARSKKSARYGGVLNATPEFPRDDLIEYATLPTITEDVIERLTRHEDVVDFSAALGCPLDSSVSPSRGGMNRSCVTEVNVRRLLNGEAGPYVGDEHSPSQSPLPVVAASAAGVVGSTLDDEILHTAGLRVRISAIDEKAGSGKFARGYAIAQMNAGVEFVSTRLCDSGIIHVGCLVSSECSTTVYSVDLRIGESHLEGSCACLGCNSAVTSELGRFGKHVIAALYVLSAETSMIGCKSLRVRQMQLPEELDVGYNEDDVGASTDHVDARSRDKILVLGPQRSYTPHPTTRKITVTREEAEAIFDFKSESFVTAGKGIVVQRVRTLLLSSGILGSLNPIFVTRHYAKQRSTGDSIRTRESKFDAHVHFGCKLKGCKAKGWVGIDYDNYDANSPTMEFTVIMEGACLHFVKEEEYNGANDLRGESRASTVLAIQHKLSTGPLKRGSGPTAVYND
jgi:hypothetical protein